MIDYLISSAEALVLTIAIEAGIVWLLGWRSKPVIWAVVLINVITNPLLNYLLLVNNNYQLITQTNALIFSLEAGVIIAEWRLLAYVLRRRDYKILWLSALINTSSFLGGLLVFR
jgi:hypothetical protein